MKRNLVIGSIIIIVLAFGLVRREFVQPPSEPVGTIKVVATFYPLAYFAQAIGADHVAVTTIVPPGVEPHEFEPSARDTQRVQGAKIFLTNGGDVDGWADSFKKLMTTHGGTVVAMNEVLVDIDLNKDPHIWLDLVYAAREVRAIRDALVTIDPVHKDTYNQNAEMLTERLAKLDEDYRSGFSQCPNKEIIVSHDAFQFLNRRYGLVVDAITGISPHEEPSAKALADLSTLATSKHITTVFFETLVSPKLAETLAKTVGAQTMELNPIEGVSLQDQQMGKNYETIMQTNLDHLKRALGCT